MITGSAGSTEWAANIEVKCVDLTANPYLLLAGLLAAGIDGVASEAKLPEPVDVDPAALAPEELTRRGIRRLPTGLRESMDALAADAVLREALGSALVDSVLAVRASEIEQFAEASAEEVVRAVRWAHCSLVFALSGQKLARSAVPDGHARSRPAPAGKCGVVLPETAAPHLAQVLGAGVVATLTR